MYFSMKVVDNSKSATRQLGEKHKPSPKSWGVSPQTCACQPLSLKQAPPEHVFLSAFKEYPWLHSQWCLPSRLDTRAGTDVCPAHTGPELCKGNLQQSVSTHKKHFRYFLSKKKKKNHSAHFSNSIFSSL